MASQLFEGICKFIWSASCKVNQLIYIKKFVLNLFVPKLKEKYTNIWRFFIVVLLKCYGSVLRWYEGGNLHVNSFSVDKNKYKN